MEAFVNPAENASVEIKPFLDRDEFIIFMNYPPGQLGVDDLKRIRDVDIRTAWMPLVWTLVEPEMGKYEWDTYDAIVERLSEAGLKVLLSTYQTALNCAPTDWYLRAADGTLMVNNLFSYGDNIPWNELSPWNEDAMVYERAFFQRVIDHYAPLGTVQAIKGGCHSGENVLPGMTEFWYDAKAIESFRQFAYAQSAGDLKKAGELESMVYPSWSDVWPASLPNYQTLKRRNLTAQWLGSSLLQVELARQSVFANQPWREFWTYYPLRDSPYGATVETGPRTGNWIAPTMYDEFPRLLGARLQNLLFEVFRRPWGEGTTGTEGILDAVKGYESATWVGAEYIDGLYQNTRRAIDLGLRGFLSGPIHPFSGRMTLEQDAIDALRYSLGEWRAARL